MLAVNYRSPSGGARHIALDSLLKTHDEPFIVIDRSFAIVAVNVAYEQRFGMPGEAIVGTICHLTFEGPQPGGATRLPYGSQQRFFETGEPYTELRTHVDPHGGTCQVRVRGFPIVGDDGAIYLGEAMQPLTFSPPTHGNSPKMAGGSRVFKELLSRLDQAGNCNAAVLLQGETGTGKELAAEYIHRQSSRHGKPFVVVDCTVLTQDLCESELFGHEKGAFTGSVGSRKGLFEVADGGTLFLDELGEMPLGLQAKLLRALERGTFRRVGSTKTLHADVRIVCATNRDLPRMVKTGAFRQDLYYRVGVFRIELPALHTRREDIPLVADALLESIGTGTGDTYGLSPAALAKLMTYPFPGNIRELRNTLHLGASLCCGGTIGPEHIQLQEVFDAGSAESEADMENGELDDAEIASFEALEARHLAQLLKKHGGNRSKAADAAGISERTLYRKLNRLKDHLE